MDLFGYQLTPTVIVGSAVSILLSFAGFVIGMRVAKERADRAALRKIYQDFYAHFREIKDAAEYGRPCDWSHYRKGERYLPLAHAMEHDGSLNLLPHRMASRFIELEKSALKAGHDFKKVVNDELTPLVRGIVEERVTKPSEPISGKRYASYDIGLMVLTQNNEAEISKRLDNKDLGVSIELSMERGYSRMLYLYPSKMKSGQLSDVVREIDQAALTHVATQQAANELKRAIKKIVDLLQTISGRIKDPHPLIETLCESVPDIFRR